MKIWFSLAILLLSAAAHAVGFQRISVPTVHGATMDVAVWYPSPDRPGNVTMGPFTQLVARDGALEGTSLPLVLISHGSGGSQFGHYDTAMALAQAGYVVAAPMHPGDNYADQSQSVAIMNRPRHMVDLLDYMLGSWPGHAHIDAGRIGIFGFSAGGFTALVDIGGKPDLKTVIPYCAEHASDFGCALLAKQKGPLPPLAPVDGLGDNRIRAAVIAAPALGFTFGKAGLENVRIPVQLWRAEDDTVLPHPAYAEAVRLALPQAPEYHVVPKAGHYDFLAPCSDQLAAAAPIICVSAAGFDRSAFHAEFNAAVVGFFDKQLKP